MSKQISQRTITPNTGSKWLYRSLFLFVIFTVMMGAGGHWLLNSPSGLKWLLSTTSGLSGGALSFSGVSGTLRSIRAESIQFVDDDLKLNIKNFEFNWQPSALFSRKLVISQLAAQGIDVLSPPSSDPMSLPEGLSLPVALSIENISIASLRIFTEKTAPAMFTATDIATRLESNGQTHYLSNLQTNLEFGAIAVSARISGDKPFNLEGKIKLGRLTQLADSELSNTLISALVTGNLSQLDLNIMTSQGLKVSSDLQLQPFESFPVASLSLSIADLNPNTFLPDAPAANLSLNTKLSANDNGQLVGNLVIKNLAPGPIDSGNLPIDKISSDLTLATEQFQLENLLIGLTDNGLVSGSLLWINSEASGSANLNVNQLNPLALDTRLRAARIDGQIKLTGDIDKQQFVVALKDDAFNLDAEITRTPAAINLKQVQLRHNQSLLTVDGELNLEAHQPYAFQGSLTSFNFADFLQAPHSDLNARFDITGSLSDAISGSLFFNIENSTLDSQPVSGKGTLEFSDTNQAKGSVDLQVGSNIIQARGAFGNPGDVLQLDITAPALAQIGLGFDGSLNLHANLSGGLAAPGIRFDITANHLMLPGNHGISSLVAHGSLQNEMISLNFHADEYRVNGEMQLQQLNIAVTGHQSDHQITAEMQLDDVIEVNLVAAGGLAASTPISADSKWMGQLLQLSATGPVPLNLMTATELELGRKHVFLGATELTISGGQASIEKLQWSPQQWQTQGRFTGISLQAETKSEQDLEQIMLGATELNFDGEQTHIERHQWQTQNLSITNSLQPDNNFVAKQQALQLGGEWHFTSVNHLTGQLHITREKGDWVIPGESPLPLGLHTLKLTAKVNQGYLTGNLAIKGKRVGETDVHINLPLSKSGNNWTISPNAPLDGQAVINIDDISWIGQVLGENVESEGQFNLQANITGTLDNPLIKGNVHGEDLDLNILDHGILLQQGKLAANFDHTSLNVEKLEFVTPNIPPPDDPLLDKLKLDQTPGSLSISGVLRFDENDNDLLIQFDRLTIFDPFHHWVLVSGKTQLGFSEDKLTLAGDITLDAGFLTQPPVSRPKLAEDVVINKPSAEEAKGKLLNINATLDLGSKFYLRASGLEGRLSGRIQLTNDEQNNLYAIGSIATHDASFNAYGQSLTVKRGIVYFNGPLNDPELSVLAIREDTAVDAGVEVTGSVRHPRIKLVTNSDMPDSERLSWLVFGRPLESSGSGFDTTMLIAAAGSILGEQSGGITRQLQQTLGVDELSIRQEGSKDSSYGQTNSTLITQSVGSLSGGGLGSDTLSGQIGTVGKRISDRLYISYEQGLSETNAAVTKLTYKVTPKINVVTRAGADNAADVVYTFRFD